MSAPATTPPPYLSTRPDGYVATKLWIDSVPEYSLLPNCAENRVSAIVRGMVNGCGDGGKYTSFGCFCYSSSTRFNSLVGAQVATACNDQSAVTSAQNVFSKYCQQGQTPGVAPSSAIASVTPSAVQTTSASQVNSTPSSATIAISSPTSQAASASSPSSSPAHSSIAAASTTSSANNAAKIAAGISIPIVIIALLIAAFFAHRYKKRPQVQATPEHGLPAEMSGEKELYTSTTQPVEKYRYSTAELPAQKNSWNFVELPAHSGH